MAKRGRKPKEKKDYFGQEEEQAVVDFLNSTSDEERNRIYNTILYPAFTKMIESIIRTFKLFIPDEEFEKTFYDSLSNLTTKMNNYDPSNGTKAYSYFGTVCKNHLIQKSKRFAKEQKRCTPFDEHIEELSDASQYYTSDTENSDIASNVITKMSNEISNMISEREKYSLKDEEVRVGLALVELLDNWESLLLNNGSEPTPEKFDSCSNKLRKSKVLYFLREETMMTTKEVRENMKVFKNLYPIIKKSCLE